MISIAGESVLRASLQVAKASPQAVGLRSESESFPAEIASCLEGRKEGTVLEGSSEPWSRRMRSRRLVSC